MAKAIAVGIIGGGWPAAAHAKGYQAAGGFRLAAVADLIPSRRQKLMADFAIAKQYASAEELLEDKQIEAVSVCLPNDLHQPVAAAALRAGKHVLCETPPALDAKQARRMQTAAERDKKMLMYALARRFGAAEQASAQAIAKGYLGEAYQVRTHWTRTRGIPAGTGWYTEKNRSGGGAMIDLGLPMLDLAWHLLGQPALQRVLATGQRRFSPDLADAANQVEDAMVALLQFEHNKTIELSAAWAINQPPAQKGSLCRVYGTLGCLEVYTPAGATLHRNFTEDGEPASTVLKEPKTVGYEAMMRQFRRCITENAPCAQGAAYGVSLMEIVDAIYKSAGKEKAV